MARRKATKRRRKKKEYIRIDFDGLSDRVTRVPIDADNFNGLVVTKDYLVSRALALPFTVEIPSRLPRSFSSPSKIARKPL